MRKLTRIKRDIIEGTRSDIIRIFDPIDPLNTIHANPKATSERFNGVAILQNVAHQVIPEPTGAPTEQPQRHHGTVPGDPTGVGEYCQPVVGAGDQVVHQPLTGPDRESRVGHVLLDPLSAGAVLPYEDVSPSAVGALDGDVAGQDVEHALDHGQGLVRLGLESQERSAESRCVGAVYGCR